MEKIQPPTNCPSCDTALIFRNDQLYCTNTDCSSRAAKAIEHWAKALKIKGLGPRTIEKLNLTSINDIYELNTELAEEDLNSIKLAEKLITEIEKSKNSTLENILPAFGIPLIGNSATSKLKETVSSLEEITKEKAEQAGLGPKATENLINWLELEFPKFKDLPLKFYFGKTTKRPSKNQVVCITGKLSTFRTKADAVESLEEAGFEVKSSLTKDVTILINESGTESTKTRKARQSGITIITNINQLLGD